MQRQPEAIAAASAVASELGFLVDEVRVVYLTNRLTVRLLPCNLLARVVPPTHRDGAAFELDVARRLATAGSPVTAPDPRVDSRLFEHDGFGVTLWTYHELASSSPVAPADYARALQRLHAGMREVEIPAPHFTSRSEDALQIVANRDRSPDLPDEDRELLTTTVRSLTAAIIERAAPEQLIHGEPHPGNLLQTKSGLLFTDFETCCRGPIEFDIAGAPDDVAAHYPGIDHALLRDCRVLAIALIAAWRCDRDDRFPNRDEERRRYLSHVRSSLTQAAENGE
jgi:aminoglycoside phosphotransferase (APT) family kinase protein